MKGIANRKSAAVAALLLVATGAVGSQVIGQVIKVFGVAAAVKQFGPQINSAVNNLTKHQDTNADYTRVVPIISAGLGGNKAVGAAQITGPKSKVMLVQAVAQFEQGILGNAVRIRAMIPVSSRDVIKDIRKVEGVGVSGIVDLKI